MEITCNRCHQTVEAESCYCPACGLPQLVYSTDGPAGPTQPERWDEAARDAATIDWKPALRAALLLAVPAGVLSSEATPMGHLGLVWMTAAAAWAVVLYMRSQRPAWITLGAGARIGLVTGLLAAWLAFGISGGALFVERYVLHQSSQIDAEYSSLFVDRFHQGAQQSIAGMGPADAAQAQAIFGGMQAWLMSPEGHAAMWAGSIAFSSFFLLLCAVGGGALGARMLVRSRRPEV
jgi:RNA polymerase subunit RPABC4/transcription elongation factor Spt4